VNAIPIILRLLFVLVVAAAAIRSPDLARRVLGAFAAAMIAVLLIAWVDHLRFPLQLELMENVILQHVRRAASGLAVYPAPTPAYVPLAYNPLYYYLSVPFVWLFGANLPTLRFVAGLGMVGSGVVIFLAVRRHTGSRWWALIATGLFASAYVVMDSYLDNAHSDSWLLFLALLGSYVIDRAESTRDRVIGIVLLVLSFWCKQHGALFTVGGVAYLTWRLGWRRSLPYWALAAVLGPLLYLAAGSWPFGPDFHYFTWHVPSGWSRLDAYVPVRLTMFALTTYAVLIAGAAWALLGDAERPRALLTVWDVQWLVAIASAFMGTLDWGSSTNVFIPFGTFTIILGTIGLARWRPHSAYYRGVQAVVLALAFVPLIYDPRSIIMNRRAKAAYADFVATIQKIPGTVYAPDIGPSTGPLTFTPGEHWVALEDLGRGPGHTDAERAQAAALLDPVIHPTGPAYIVTYDSLSAMTPPVGTLTRYYVLDQDFGTRFVALRGVPKHFDHAYPRYLYRYRGADSVTTR
jgi:hypothetical protein